MANNISLIDLGKLSKPANTLIEKISDAIGGIAKPGQIRRIAKADADANIIKAEARIKISELEERGLKRMVREEGQKQENIENITAKAIPNLSKSARPEQLEKDWITYFFEKSRLTSDTEMQTLWAGILSGEANAPGSFSKRSVDLVASLDKRDAELFTKLCSLRWTVGFLSPLVFDEKSKIYEDLGLTYGALTHLTSIGLITFGQGFQQNNMPKHVNMSYFGRVTQIEFPTNKNDFVVGKVVFTQAGKELATISGSKQSDEFYFYVIKEWIGKGYVLSSPLKKLSKINVAQL